ncbi:MAG: hypothetical protein IKN83_06565, partial [Bacteroidaceae bacterium]|nr:hypothetical protein [Bacteroidaceae bacterium]
SLGVFVLDSIYTKIAGKADGDTIQIAFKSSEEGEFAGQIVLSCTGADSVFVALKAIVSPADTIPEQLPSIIASVDTLTFTSAVGDSIIQELVISGEHLTDSIKVDLVDSLGVFVLDSIYTKIVGKADGDTIQIAFKSSEEGEFAGQIVLSSTGADSVFVALKAIVSPADTIPEQIPSIITSVDTLTFTSVVGDSIIQELVISGEYLTDSIKVDLVDSLGVFVLDSIYTKIVGKADGDTIQIAFKSSEEGEFAGQIVLSSTGADSVFVALKAIVSPADTIPEQLPSIIASVDTLSFETPIGVETVQSVMVKGIDLSDSILLSVEDSLGLLRLDSAYISLDKAIAGNAVAVYFAPKDKTSEVGLLKLSSKDAQPVLITLICRSDYELGDVNKDDVVDISDVVMTVNYVLGNETNESVLVYGDMDGNGIIDITDVVALVNQILQVSNE